MDLKTYNPATLASLSKEDAEAMASLTTAEINQLAKEYPNDAKGKTYIILKDKTLPDHKQLFAPSTWANLAALHRLGKTNYVAVAPSEGFTKATGKSVKSAPVQDLTNQEAKDELKASQSDSANDVNSSPVEDLDLPGLRERYEMVTGNPAGKLSKEKLIEGLTPTAPAKVATKAASKKTASKKAATKKADK